MYPERIFKVRSLKYKGTRYKLTTYLIFNRKSPDRISSNITLPYPDQRTQQISIIYHFCTTQRTRLQELQLMQCRELCLLTGSIHHHLAIYDTPPRREPIHRAPHENLLILSADPILTLSTPPEGFNYTITRLLARLKLMYCLRDILYGICAEYPFLWQSAKHGFLSHFTSKYTLLYYQKVSDNPECYVIEEFSIRAWSLLSI